MLRPEHRDAIYDELVLEACEEVLVTLDVEEMAA
jgi:hypothetical protein